MENYKISFCTTAMGRLDHVRQTLLINIANTDDYPDAEFVLLDYGSKDGLGSWVRENALDLIQTYRLSYLRLDGVEFYSHAHSKNVVFLASTGQVMCNIDADNVMPRGFAFHLNELMHRHDRAIAGYGKSPSNVKGRLAMFRADFMAVAGYDESLVGWGWDDKDLRDRLRAQGCQIQWMDTRFAACLEHGHERRTENMHPRYRQRWLTSHRNAELSQEHTSQGKLVANVGKSWGSAVLTRNFAESVSLGIQQAQAGGP